MRQARASAARVHKKCFFSNSKKSLLCKLFTTLRKMSDTTDFSREVRVPPALILSLLPESNGNKTAATPTSLPATPADDLDERSLVALSAHKEQEQADQTQ